MGVREMEVEVGRGSVGSDGACDGGEGVRVRRLPKWMEKMPGNRRRGLRKGRRDGQSRGKGCRGPGGGYWI